MPQLDGMGNPLPDDVTEDHLAGVPVVTPVVNPAPRAVVSAVSIPAPGVLDGVKPGHQTTEFKLAVAVITVVNTAAGLFVALAGGGLIAPSDALLAEVPAVAAALTGWITTNYINSRTDIKAAAQPQG